MHAFQACAFNRSATSPQSFQHGKAPCCGERRIRTYGTVPGTPDFESGAFDHSASSPDCLFTCDVGALAAKPAEELLENLTALRLEDPGGHLEPVVVSGLCREVVERAHRPRLRVP